MARVGCELFRNFENVFERAAEIVDHDDRSLPVSKTPDFGLHLGLVSTGGGRHYRRPPNAVQKI
jgi:hypothetical protein